MLKESFPKLDIDPLDITIDMKEDAVLKLAQHYDRLVSTDILFIYNIMNEIPTDFKKLVWKNIKFLLDIFQRPVLILLMEPSSERAEPRIHWLKIQLAQETELIKSGKEDLFAFDTEPVCIKMDSSGDCLNHRLFGIRIRGAKPTFETTSRRSHLACFKKPNSPISLEQVTRQLSDLDIKRGRRGDFLSKYGRVRQQYTFGYISEHWR